MRIDITPATSAAAGAVDVLPGDRGSPLDALTDDPRVDAPRESSFAIPEEYAFSATMILALVTLRVRSLEQDLARLVQTFESHTSGADELSRELEALQLVQQQAHAKDGPDVTLDQVVDAAGGKTVEQLLLEAGFPRDSLDLKDGRVLAAGTLEAMISQKSSELKRHNTGSELQMLRIQSLVQARGEAISLGTNLLGKLGERNDEVIRNLA